MTLDGPPPEEALAPAVLGIWHLIWHLGHLSAVSGPELPTTPPKHAKLVLCPVLCPVDAGRGCRSMLRGWLVGRRW